MSNEYSEMLLIDELIHLTKQKEWNKGVKNIIESQPDMNILGISATPIRYSDGQKNMIDELLDGHNVSEISLFEAIARKILKSPKYVVGLYDFEETYQEMVDTINNSRIPIDQRIEARKKLNKLKIDWDKTNGVEQILANHLNSLEGKFIVFCESIEHLQTMEVQMIDFFTEVSRLKKNNCKLNKWTVSSKFTNSENNKSLKEFEKSSNGINLLFSVNMLNEGIHIKDIDGVIMLRRTSSPTIYYQQLGRCLSVNSEKTTIVFDLVGNINSLKSDKTNYKKQLDYAVEKENSNREAIGLKTVNVGTSFTDTTIDLCVELEKLNKSFRLDRNPNTFEQWVDLLLEYKEEYKTVNVPDKEEYKGQNLGFWVVNQRKEYKNNKLDPKRIELLEKIGFVWDVYESQWLEKFELLKEYKKKYMHFNVPQNFKYKGINICSWVSTQRNEYKNNKLDTKRIELLEKIGLVLDVYESQWLEKFELLKAYKEEYKTFSISNDNKKEIHNLRSWMTNQRKYYRDNALDDEKIRLLESIGFVWDVYESQWLEKFELLKEYKKEHKTCSISNDNKKESNGLFSWVIYQRRYYKDNALDDEKIRLLESIDFAWNPNESQWLEKFELLKEYKEEYKTVNVPNKEEYKGQNLGSWKTSQRMNYKRNLLSDNKIKLLESVGFVWDILELQWLEKFELLKEYKEEYKTVNIPQKEEYKGQNLGFWVSNQRSVFNNNKLNAGKFELLESIGFVWKIKFC